MAIRELLQAAVVTVSVLALSDPCVAQITGTVKLHGEPPEMSEIQLTGDCAAHQADPIFDETVVAGENGELANVIVSLKQIPDGVKPEAPKEPAALDQVGCRYTPHVIAVMVGQPVVVKNSDPHLHNVHTLSKENPEDNFGQPNVDPGRELPPLEEVETFRVKCDVHPWMSAYVRVLEHPFHATTGDDGTFALKLPDGIKDGDYTLVFWHEKYGEKEQAVKVTGGKATVDFTFAAD
jgi:plastocyanin